MADAIATMVDLLTKVTTVITGSTVLFATFVGGLFIVAAKVFKRIKKAAK